MYTIATQNIATSNDAPIHDYLSADVMDENSHDLIEGTEEGKTTVRTGCLWAEIRIQDLRKIKFYTNRLPLAVSVLTQFS